MHKWSSKHKEFLENKLWIWSCWNVKKSLGSDFSMRYLASDTNKIPWKNCKNPSKIQLMGIVEHCNNSLWFLGWEIPLNRLVPLQLWACFQFHSSPSASPVPFALPHHPSQALQKSFQREPGCKMYLSKLIRQNGKWVFRHHPGIKGKSSNKTGNIFCSVLLHLCAQKLNVKYSLDFHECST